MPTLNAARYRVSERWRNGSRHAGNGLSSRAANTERLHALRTAFNALFRRRLTLYAVLIPGGRWTQRLQRLPRQFTIHAVPRGGLRSGVAYRWLDLLRPVPYQPYTVLVEEQATVNSPSLHSFSS